MSPVPPPAHCTSHPRHSAITFLLVGLIGLLGVLTPYQHARAATRYYVNDNTPEGGNGLAWGTAFRYLQDALSFANAGDEIWVAAGVYYPDLSTLVGDSNGPTANFPLETGVALYGGFAGSESDLSQRNVAANVTVLSGDLTQNDRRDVNGVVTNPANINSLGPNAVHVVTANGVSAGARLDGFTITAGKATSGSGCPTACGGGVYASNGSPTLANLTVIGNLAGFGGGIMFHNTSTPRLTDVIIRNNESTGNGGGMQIQDGANAYLTRVQVIQNVTAIRGGGIYIHLADAVLEDVLFSENRTTNTNDGNGGGIYNFQSSPTLANVTFSGNFAIFGGGLYNNESDPTLTDVTFSGNKAFVGGGLANLKSEPFLINVTFSGNVASDGSGGGMLNNESDPVLTNVTFSGNHANFGGGLANLNSDPVLTNVTFSGNHSPIDRGDALFNSDSSPLIQNTIFWDNLPTSVYDVESTPIYRYSLVQGLFPAGGSNVGNLDGISAANAPHFVTPVNCGSDGCADDLATTGVDESANDAYGDLHLLSGSPAIDAGDNAADLDGINPSTLTIAAIATDLAGQPRIVASKSLPAIVDMGAYEAAVFAPVAQTGGPYTAVEGGVIALDASASTDDVNIVTYGWDCTNDGTVDVTANAPTGSTCPYPNSGSYTLRLAATDNMNATGTATTPVTVANLPPVYTPAANQSTLAGSVKSFSLGSFSDPGVEGTWAIQVDWGDDTTPTQFTVNSAGTLPTKNHTYGAAGTYNVAVTTSDDTVDVNDGFQVVVNAAPPGAPIVTPPANQEGAAATEQSFALGSFSDVGSAGPWSVTIAWGDGSANTLFSVTSSGEILAKSHTYAAPGDYEVSVTVSDGVLSFIATFSVTIPEPAEEGSKIFLPAAAKP